MPQIRLTKPGTRKLSEVTKHLVIPSGIVSTGYPAVAAQCRKMGVVHDDWQQGLGKAILAKRDTGLYAAGIGGVILSTCRQVGKTFTFGTLIFALCILTQKTTVLWTAHHSKTSDETFEALAGMTMRSQIAPYVKKVMTGNGKQSIHFTNGSRILFGAREHGFGRGIPGVTIVVFDEGQILKQSALNDMVPAANTVKNPLILYMGTPPDPKDPSEVFKGRRRKMLAIEKARAAGEAASSDTLYVEIGADADADLDDRKQWAKGNPSFPLRTPAESIMRLREQLGDDSSFRREGMGIWDDDQEGSRAISPVEWSSTGVEVALTEGVRSFAVAFSFDGTRLALSGGLKHDDGIHVELIDAADGDIASGLSALADWLADRWRNVAVIVLSGAAGAPVLAQLLKDRKVPDVVVKIVTTPEYTQSCSMTLDAVRESAAAVKRDERAQFTHLALEGQSQLDESVSVSDKKNRGMSGAWAWSATTPDGDETPIESMSLAYWAAKTTKRKPRGDRERKAVFL
ncbi:terminase [Cryobacterium sp. Y62]|uniref:terminase n=1 Tax=Cryobacterium sp. Y62 TaxID=2048284 RepID=UPI0013047D1E|nr:terminase [Cryobacterium sp. Y62]